MPERTYNQYCGLAHALDLVGERWALLVVRELALGGKRFTDLREGLPGIGTNVLATRLRQLQADGVVRKLRLMPPADTTVYMLTDLGVDLVPAMLALGRWGAQTMGPPEAGQELRSNWLAVAMRAFFQPGDTVATIEIELRDGPFRIDIDGERIDIGAGHAIEADLRMRVDDEALLGYLRGDAPAPKAEGDQRLLRRLPEIFAFSPRSSAPAAPRSARRSPSRRTTRSRTSAGG
jgi:DNA-binding HxlR family transcriptional regulator